MIPHYKTPSKPEKYHSYALLDNKEFLKTIFKQLDWSLINLKKNQNMFVKFNLHFQFNMIKLAVCS